ncbi:(Fe-S)-binding protein [Desulfurispora thermophila]|uniref:(Fe-S)-binding protein n=1 Tax=Desulfurispora thermophila TaxID=265470 RepID=UPI000378EE6F|nr:(Fe-S)-binding protein [Desulfurispora thermophila]
MPLPIGDTIGILSDNLHLRRSVLPLPTAAATQWARGLSLPRGGETVLYTGLMYQLIPYITAMSRAQEKLENSRLTAFTGLGRRVNKVINISAFMARPPAALRQKYNSVLAGIVRLLQAAGLNVGYLYEDDLYSGALVYDLGVDRVVEEQARRVWKALQRHGVRRVITVDPHTTHMLRSVYPQLLPGYDLEVRSYLEVLAERGLEPRQELTGTVAVHDSCLYARAENVQQEPRLLLARAGLEIKEPVHWGEFTRCCGGPAESLFPARAHELAGQRVAELKAAAPAAVTMCPICLVNLQKAAGELAVDDIVTYLARAYL